MSFTRLRKIESRVMPDDAEAERQDARLLDLLEVNQQRPEVNWDAHTPTDRGAYEEYSSLQDFIDNVRTSRANHPDKETQDERHERKDS